MIPGSQPERAVVVVQVLGLLEIYQEALAKLVEHWDVHQTFSAVSSVMGDIQQRVATSETLMASWIAVSVSHSELIACLAQDPQLGEQRFDLLESHMERVLALEAACLRALEELSWQRATPEAAIDVRPQAAAQPRRDH